jgi:diacylglycerol kinase family enzyme
MVSIGNAPRTGGLFYTVPAADPRDGKLSFIHAGIPTRLGILRALPKILRLGKGNITEHPKVFSHHATRLSVRADRPTPIHADGELFAQWGTDFEFDVHPGKVPVLVD